MTAISPAKALCHKLNRNKDAPTVGCILAYTGNPVLSEGGMVSAVSLPQLQPLSLRDEELVALLHIKGLVPGINVWQGTVDAPLTK